MTEMTEEDGSATLQKILVTGSSGFIGQALCRRLLADGLSVLGLDTREPGQAAAWEHRTIDVMDSEALSAAFEQYQPDAIIHLAARTDLEGKTVEDYEVNRQGVRNICDVVAATPSVRRSIYTSSQLVCAIGSTPKSDTDYSPNTVYGESKVATEMVVRETNGGDVCWSLVRPTTVWGPGMSQHYQTVLRMIDKGIFFHSGWGALYKSYAFIDNIVHQYVQLLHVPRETINGRTFVLADYEPFSLRDYLNALADELGRRRPVTVPLPAAHMLAFAGDVLNRVGVPFPYNSFRLNNIRTEYTVDVSKTEEVCGPVPVSFPDGVKRTVAWFRSA